LVQHASLLEPIGYVPPAEYEAQYYAQASKGALVGRHIPTNEVDATAERLQDFLRPSLHDRGATEVNA
jgi:hypothetical protein